MSVMTVNVRRSDLAEAKAFWTEVARTHGLIVANRDAAGQVFVQLFLDRRSTPARRVDSVYVFDFTFDRFTNTLGTERYNAVLVD